MALVEVSSSFLGWMAVNNTTGAHTHTRPPSSSSFFLDINVSLKLLSISDPSSNNFCCLVETVAHTHVSKEVSRQTITVKTTEVRRSDSEL